MTAREIARLWRVTPQAVGLWAKKEGCPRLDDGSYDLPEVIAWRERWIRESASIGAGPAGGSAAERKLEAEAKLKELTLKLRTAEVIPVEQVERDRVTRVQVLRRGLIDLPRRMAPMLEGLDAIQIRGLLNDEIETLIRQFAGQE